MIKSWKDVVFIIVFFLIIGITVKGCCSCVSEPTPQEQKMKRTFEKKERGEDLTPKEQETIDNYYEWKYERDSNE